MAAAPAPAPAAPAPAAPAALTRQNAVDLDAPAEAAAAPVDLAALYERALKLSTEAVERVEEAKQEELRSMAERLRAEQRRYHDMIKAALPGAVTAAASAGSRVAVLHSFVGADKLEDFCYLYMLKGPVRQDEKAEMRAMGAEPLMWTLKRELNPAGFYVHHTWQRATNENKLCVMW